MKTTKKWISNIAWIVLLLLWTACDGGSTTNKNSATKPDSNLSSPDTGKAEFLAALRQIQALENAYLISPEYGRNQEKQTDAQIFEKFLNAAEQNKEWNWMIRKYPFFEKHVYGFREDCSASALSPSKLDSYLSVYERAYQTLSLSKVFRAKLLYYLSQREFCSNPNSAKVSSGIFASEQTALNTQNSEKSDLRQKSKENETFTKTTSDDGSTTEIGVLKNRIRKNQPKNTP